jgi:hypothetical protein
LDGVPDCIYNALLLSYLERVEFVEAAELLSGYYGAWTGGCMCVGGVVWFMSARQETKTLAPTADSTPHQT